MIITIPADRSREISFKAITGSEYAAPEKIQGTDLDIAWEYWAPILQRASRDPDVLEYAITVFMKGYLHDVLKIAILDRMFFISPEWEQRWQNTKIVNTVPQKEVEDMIKKCALACMQDDYSVRWALSGTKLPLIMYRFIRTKKIKMTLTAKEVCKDFQLQIIDIKKSMTELCAKKDITDGAWKPLWQKRDNVFARWKEILLLINQE